MASSERRARISWFIIWRQNTLKRFVIDESGANAGQHSFRVVPRENGDAALLAQLGLQLNEENRNVEILIVDHASQAPPDR